MPTDLRTSRPHAMITGATSGIGYETCIALAQHGYEITLLGRDQTALNALRAKLRELAPANAFPTICADLSLRKCIESAATQITALQLPIHLLIHNAGIISDRLRQNDSGWELTLCVNHLAPFILTQAARPLLRHDPDLKSGHKGPTVLVVASQAHRYARLDFADMHFVRRSFDPYRVYATSKLCNILFARQLRRELADLEARVMSWHPGVVASRFGQSQRTWLSAFLRVARPFLRTPLDAAGNAISLCVGDLARASSYDYFVKERGHPGSAASRNEGFASQLWDFSLEAIKTF